MSTRFPERQCCRAKSLRHELERLRHASERQRHESEPMRQRVQTMNLLRTRLNVVGIVSNAIKRMFFNRIAKAYDFRLLRKFLYFLWNVLYAAFSQGLEYPELNIGFKRIPYSTSINYLQEFSFISS